MERFNPSSKSGDSERIAEFVELYSQHYQRLQYYVMALLPTPTDAADVLQETSLVLWKKFETFESGTNFFAWACTIARLQTKKHYQSTNRSAVLLAESTLELVATEAMEAVNNPTLAMDALESCLDKLDESDRKLICRRYEAGVSVKAIAAEIGVTPNFLSKTFSRIRRNLLTCIQATLAREA